MHKTSDDLVVRRSVPVRCTPEHAFPVFTERMSDWYPLEGHSIFDDRESTVVWEGRVGGQVYELSSSGEKGVWGTIVAWDPPQELAMTWHPGRGEETAQELRVSFTAEGDGTRVEVVHTGWERVGPDFRARMIGYEKGWSAVLDDFARYAGAATGARTGT
jgi:Activator of Hsp90 ATPase homolog 1-like protein